MFNPEIIETLQVPVLPYRGAQEPCSSIPGSRFNRKIQIMLSKMELWAVYYNSLNYLVAEDMRCDIHVNILR